MGTVCTTGDGTDGVEPLPVEMVPDNGRLALWRPRPTNRGALRETALVYEDDGGLCACPLTGPLFISGHSSRTQPAIASSFRSLARRSGFWTDQPCSCISSAT